MSLDRWTNTTLDGVRVNLTSVHRGVSPKQVFLASLLLLIASVGTPLAFLVGSRLGLHTGSMAEVIGVFGMPFVVVGVGGLVGSQIGLVPPILIVDISQHTLRVEQEGQAVLTLPLATITDLSVKRSRIVVNTTDGVHSFRVYGRSRKTLRQIRSVLETHVETFQVKQSSADIPEHLREMRRARPEGSHDGRS